MGRRLAMDVRVLRACRAHLKPDGRVDVPSLAASLGIDQAEARRHLRNLRRNGADVPPTDGRCGLGRPSKFPTLEEGRELIPRFTRGKHLDRKALAAHLGVCPSTLYKFLKWASGQGLQVPPARTSPASIHHNQELVRAVCLRLLGEGKVLTKRLVAAECNLSVPAVSPIMNGLQKAGVIPFPEHQCSTVRGEVLSAYQKLRRKGQLASSDEIAQATGRNMRTVRTHLRMLRAEGQIPPYSRKGYKRRQSALPGPLTQAEEEGLVRARMIRKRRLERAEAESRHAAMTDGLSFERATAMATLPPELEEHPDEPEMAAEVAEIRRRDREAWRRSLGEYRPPRFTPPEALAPADACRVYLREHRAGRMPHFMSTKAVAEDDED